MLNRIGPQPLPPHNHQSATQHQSMPVPAPMPTPQDLWLNTMGDQPIRPLDLQKVMQDKNIDLQARVRGLINLTFEVKNGEVQNRKQALLQTLTQLLKSPESGLRLAAVEMIADLGKPQTLLPLMGDRDPQVREAVKTILQAPQHYVSQNHDVRMLARWKEIKPEILKMIDTAQKTIQIDIYVFSGQPGREITDHLIKKAKQGVQVRVMIDPKEGSMKHMVDATRQYMKELEKAGAQTAHFPLNLMPQASGIGTCDHNKILLVDGASYLIGGMNWAEVGINNEDMMLKVTGPSARVLAQSLDREWQIAKADFTKRLEFPPLPKVSGKSTIEVREVSLLRNDVKEMILREIANAKTSIKIGMFQFSNPEIMQALKAAHRKGVKIQILLDPNKILNVMGQHWLSDVTKMYGFPNLTAVRGLQDSGIEMRWYWTKDREQLHAKFLIIDDQKVITGSNNLTTSSFLNNREAEVLVHSSELAKDLERRLFKPNWNAGVRTEPIKGHLLKFYTNALEYMEKTRKVVYF